MPSPAERLCAREVVLRDGAAAITDAFASGEIVGLAGLDGHGQEHFLAVLAGLRAPRCGAILVPTGRGEQVLGGLRQAVRLGVAYLPRDRRSTGVFPTLSVIDNFAVATLERDRRWGLIDAGRRRARFAVFRTRLSVVARSDNASIESLSGGNQQKVLLARVLALEPRVLLLDDPTRGVDARTRLVLYDVFRDLAARGMALVLVSTEIEELQFLCDRVLVFRDGSVEARLARQDVTPERVIAAMFGRTA